MPRVIGVQDFLEEFIKEYKENECLWKMKDYSYHNPARREECYKKLRLIVAKYYGEQLGTREFVLKKIKNLRTAFRKELKKVRLCKESDEEYVPKLWYFNLLHFLADEDSSRQLTCALNNDEDNENEEADELEIKEEEQDVNSDLDDPFAMCDTQASNQPPTPSSSSTIDIPPKTQRPLKRKKDSEQLSTVQIDDNESTKIEDEFDAAGRDFAWKLRSLDTDQRFIVEKLVADVIFAARLKALKPNSIIWTPSDQNGSPGYYK